MMVHIGVPLIVASAFILLAGGVVFGVWKTAGYSGNQPHASGTNAMLSRGKDLYNLHCGSCHGFTLEGQAGWKMPLPNGRLPAPPHDGSGHTWHHPDDVLIDITLNGLKPYAGEDYESDMPAFAGILTREEAADILTYIKSNWPERERVYQQRVTDQYHTNQRESVTTPN